jgi:hypothetical protein
MDDVERVCRLICRASNIDPDQRGIGLGNRMPKDQPYKLWEAQKVIAELLLTEMHFDVKVINSSDDFPRSELRHGQ